MRLPFFLVSLLLVPIGIGIVVTCNRVSLELPTPTPRPLTPTPSIFIPTPLLENVIAFEGSGSTITQPFSSKSPTWQLKWRFRWITGDKKLTVLVFPRGERLNAVAKVESGLKPEDGFFAEGTAEVRVDPGEYYLVIEAKNIDSWRIEIRQSR